MAKSQISAFSPPDVNKRKRSNDTSSTLPPEISPPRSSEHTSPVTADWSPEEFEPTQLGYLQIGYGNAGFVSLEPNSGDPVRLGQTQEADTVPSWDPSEASSQPIDGSNSGASWLSSRDSTHPAYSSTEVDLPTFSTGHSQQLFASSGAVPGPSGNGLFDTGVSFMDNDPAFFWTGATSNTQCVMRLLRTSAR
jgi:hypothetical protein